MEGEGRDLELNGHGECQTKNKKKKRKEVVEESLGEEKGGKSEKSEEVEVCMAILSCMKFWSVVKVLVVVVLPLYYFGVLCVLEVTQ